MSDVSESVFDFATAEFFGGMRGDCVLVLDTRGGAWNRFDRGRWTMTFSALLSIAARRLRASRVRARQLQGRAKRKGLQERT